MFPADILLISSSDKDGIAYIETSTLDGEQTSKIRYAFQELNLLYR
jgi:phospholipid-transporting ATPase